MGDDRVGGMPRPPRLITVGRRRSDRWLAYTFIALSLALMGFVVQISFHVSAIEDTHTQILRQNRETLCVAADTRSFQIALADAWIYENRTSTDPQIIAIRNRLDTARQRLIESQGSEVSVQCELRPITPSTR